MGEPGQKPIEYKKRWAVRVSAVIAAVSVGAVGLVDQGVASDVALAKPAAYTSVDGAAPSQEASETCSPKKIVVLGSSTAAGQGANPSSESWVSLFAKDHPNDEIINLAASGETTYDALPDGSQPPPGRPSPDRAHNLSEALRYRPDAIIFAYSSNDEFKRFSLEETKANYLKIQEAAEEEGIPVFFTTPQPRVFSEQQTNELKELKDWIQSQFPDNSIDFWSGVANPDGTPKPEDYTPDLVHVNNTGHRIHRQEFASSHILEKVCESASSRAQH